MNAGFGKVVVTTEIGMPMEGVPARDAEGRCESIHDHLFARALYVEHDGERAAVVGLDVFRLCRETADRLRAAAADELGLAPDRILLNTSNTHSGPRASDWYHGEPDAEFLARLESGVGEASARAMESARAAILWAGEARSDLPMNRRKKDVRDVVTFAPNPVGPVCDALPIALFRDADNAPIALLCSVACHPATVKGFAVSTDYPGVTTAEIERHLGAECALFLAGTGGDAEPSVLAGGGDWHIGDWSDVDRAGRMAAREVTNHLTLGLFEAAPRVRCAEVEMEWPLLAPPPASEYHALLRHPDYRGDDPASVARRRWAREQLDRIEAEGRLPEVVPIRLHGLQLGGRVRLVGIEGDAVAELGLLMREAYREGVTFALGHTNGTQLCLPTSQMLYEGGTEVTGYFAYHHPAPLAKGMEHLLRDALDRLRSAGVR
jgi:hypothetical protein